MAKRLTPFIGLAVVAALALAAAFGAFSLNPAFAGSEAPNARGLAQPGDFQSQTVTALPVPATALEETAADTDRTDLTTATNAPGNVRLGIGGTFTFDVKNTIQPTTYADPPAAAEPDTYYVAAPEGGAVRLTPAVTTTGSMRHYVNGLQVAAGTSTEVTITGESAGTALITVTVVEASTTCTAPCAWRENSTYTFSVVVVAPTLSLSGVNPGANTRQDVTFVATADLAAGVSEITIELDKFDFPGNTTPSSVGISSDARYESENDGRITVASNLARFNEAGALVAPTGYSAGIVTPDDVSISGEELTITVPDMNPQNDLGNDIMKGDLVRVVIRQGAGINNPFEGGAYSAKITTNENTPEQETNEVSVPRRVKLDKDDGGRGTTVRATGTGFKDDTTLTFFLDKPDDNGDLNGEKDTGEVELCSWTVDDEHTASCSFNVSNPPFMSGNNFVGAVDGEGQNANKSATHNHDDQKFELKPSITTSPDSGNPGETILVQGTDFPATATLSSVKLAGDNRDLKTTQALSASVSGTGDLSFRFIIPNWAEPGRKDLTVVVATTAGATSDDSTKITIGGPTLVSTPTTVLPNQRISLVGTGFSPSAWITGSRTNDDVTPSITIGGYEIGGPRINDGDPVRVDNGGKWSASVDLPLRSVTTRDGDREIRVTDSDGRSGTVSVNIPARSVTIDPPAGRIGTEATIRGENFPSKNDNGDSFNIQITYDPGGGRETQVSTVSDASGRFETKIRIPTGATIPSTNPVRVTFDDSQETEVTTTVSHEVPEGSIILSASSGLPGTTITLRGEGFKAFVPVRSVKVGSIEVTPSPAPSTDALGQMTFDILIPGLDTGIQTIEVQVSDTTASIGFTVQTGNVPGAVTPVAEGVADLGENFVRAFNFDNDTKTWTFYDPAAGDASTMENFIAGNSYWILVGSTVDAILNRETRTLTCVNDNCWNLVVW